MRFITAYARIADDGTDNLDDLEITGPHFYSCAATMKEAEDLAREVTNMKTKDVIIARVFELDEGEKLPDAMHRIQKHWFIKLSGQTKETSRILKRDYDKALCPFREVDLERTLTLYLE
jgi:hypothetical protein